MTNNNLPWDCDNVKMVLKFFPQGIVYKVGKLREWNEKKKEKE